MYTHTHIQPPSWGVMFENPLPPPKKRGEDNLHRQNKTLKCWSLPKTSLVRFVFLIVDVDSTWDTSLPEVVGNFPPWFNIQPTFQDLDSTCCFSMFFFWKLNYTKSWLQMRGSYFFLHLEFEKQKTNSKPPWFKHDCVEISWCMFRIRSIRALKLGRCPLLGIVIFFWTLVLTYTTTLWNFIHLKPPYLDVPEVNFERNVPYEYTEMLKTVGFDVA